MKAISLVLSNPDGFGISILSLAFDGESIEMMRLLGEQIHNSVNFFPRERPKPKTKEEVKAALATKWDDVLNNVRLTYMSSFASGGGGTSS